MLRLRRVPGENGMMAWSMLLAAAVASLALALAQRRHRLERDQLQQRIRELETVLNLQEQKVKQLTAFAVQMQESEAGARAIIDNALDGVITIDHSGRIIDFNPAAEKLFGYEREAVLGKTIGETIVPPSLREAHHRGMAHFLATGEGPLLGRRVETFGWHAEGGEFPIELAITVLHPQQPPMLTAYVHDITQLRQTTEALTRAKEAAEAANRAKSDFLANVSHEIRTPMNGILGMTQLALDTELTGEQREYLQMVKTSADGLLTVINDILDFSKIEAGKLELDAIEFELRDVLADAVRSLALRASAKKLELACHVPANVPDFLVGDPTRLRQVLLNLVGNAIKFTERGEVVVRVGLTEARPVADAAPAVPTLRPGGDIELRFSVTDTGIGIAPEKIPSIFEPFVQADSSTTRKYGGTGLGLSITSQLVEMMGGRLWAVSVPGEGSTFHFTLHLRLQDRSPSRLLPRRPLDVQGLKVLVVDDHAVNRLILAELLDSWLMKPTTADSVRQALAELEAAAASGKPFPLVLLDAHLPEEDGFTLAAAIRARPHLGEAVLILLSSGNRSEYAERCRELGIAQCLLKPVKPSDLLDAIARTFVVGSGSGHDAAPPSPPTPLPSGERREDVAPLSPLGRGVGGEGTNRVLRVLLAEDNFVNQRLILALLGKQGHRVVAVANGAAAVRAVQQEKFDLVLMDVQMPELNGLEATRAIRAWEKEHGGHLPIIAMTAHAMKGARDDCLRAGMDDYLSKPIQTPKLVRLMEQLTGFRGDNVPDLGLPETKAVFDPRPLMQRIGNDSILFRELVGMFEEDCPRLLEQLRQAIAAGDADTVQRTAHQLKGSAGNFAALNVVQAAQRLEDLGRIGDLSEAADAFHDLEDALAVFHAALEEWLTLQPAAS
jgi:two-component system sensor histidine kinase/response regulator